MYYSDPLSSLGSSSSLLGTGVLAGALSVVAVLAFIALCVAGYIMLLGKNASHRTSALGRFFNFDHFYIEKVLQVLNLIAAVGIAVFACWLALSSFGSPLLILPGILLGALVFFVGQFVNRIIFEGALLFVRLVTDTQAIRNTVAGPRIMDEPPAPAAPFAPASAYRSPAAVAPVAPAAVAPATPADTPASPAAAPTAAAAPAPAPSAPEPPTAAPAQAPAPAEPQTPAPAPEAPAAAAQQQAPAPPVPPAFTPKRTWHCPACGTENDGNFCVSCGTKRP